MHETRNRLPLVGSNGTVDSIRMTVIANLGFANNCSRFFLRLGKSPPTAELPKAYKYCIDRFSSRESILFDQHK